MDVPWREIIITVGSGVGIALLIFIGRSVYMGLKNIKIFFNKISSALLKIERMNRALDLIFETQFTLFDVLEGAKVNGNVSEQRKKYQDFLIKHPNEE